MKVIVDASPLISLALIGRLNLLFELFDEIIVPSSVYHEVVSQGMGRVASSEIREAEWIRVQTPAASSNIGPVLLGLDQGEMDVLLLALEVKPDWVVIDERLGRRAAQTLRLPVKGTIGILLAAYRARLLSRSEALSSVNQLVGAGIRIGRRVIEWFEKELERP